jgi:hypothetical protein
MVAELNRTWRPAPWLPTQNQGTVTAGITAGARASWKLVIDALNGRGATRWADARVLRLDGPLATDKTLQTLAASGCLDRIEALELAGEGFTARAVAIARELPALTALRLDGISATTLQEVASSRIRRLELFQCSAETAVAVLRALTHLTAVDIDSVPSPHRSLWDALGVNTLAALRIARMPCDVATLGGALGGSSAGLESLTLDAVTGLDSDEFLVGGSWPALRSLRWQQARLARLGAGLPSTLSTLSLRGTSITELMRVDEWSSRLSGVDLVGSTASDDIARRVLAGSTTPTSLGLAASELATQVVSALAEREGSLRTLVLGDGIRDAAPRTIAAIPAALEELTLSRAWAPDESLLRGLLRGDCATGLRDLELHGVNLGNPSLDGRVSPRLRRLVLDSCRGFIEGLGAEQPLSLTTLAMDEVEVRQDELVAMVKGCKHIGSLRLERLVGLDPEGLAAVLAHAGGTLVQLVLRQFPGDMGTEYGDALVASRYPELAELWLDRTMSSGRAMTHLMDVRVTPALERLDLDYQAPDEQWLTLVERQPSALHWVHGYYRGDLESLTAMLRDSGSGVAGADLHLRRGGA